MTPLIVIASIVAYFLIGGLIAKASLPQLWQRAALTWPRSEQYRRGSVVSGAVCRALFWPALGPYELLAKQIDATNPEEQKRQIAEQKRRIAELERDLGIDR